MMRIGIVTPAPAGSTYGNRITALRWARILRGLGHHVTISQSYESKPCDLLIALHARRSYSSIEHFYRENTQVPIVVALTGTDLYRDLGNNDGARRSLEIATRIVALQPKACEKLSPEFRLKTRIIYQSAEAASGDSRPGTMKDGGAKRVRVESSGKRSFDVCVIGHLRAVKDPFRTALAARLLPDSSRIRILQIGAAMTASMALQANAEMRRNQRYQWLGEQPRSRVLGILAGSDLCVLSSRIEGGANALSEAIVQSVPVLASGVEGNIGILGPGYPGLFNVGNTRELARLLSRAETDQAFLSELRWHAKKLALLFHPNRERRAWANLIKEVTFLNQDTISS